MVRAAALEKLYVPSTGRATTKQHTLLTSNIYTHTERHRLLPPSNLCPPYYLIGEFLVCVCVATFWFWTCDCFVLVLTAAAFDDRPTNVDSASGRHRWYKCDSGL